MSQETSVNKEVRIRGLGPVTPESCVLILEELGGTRLLPIFASISDGEAIARKVAGFQPPRPLTHDLLVSTVESLGWSFVRVIVSDVKEGAFYARIVISREGAERSLDARPTDAINVALRAGCPIFVAEPVFSLGNSLRKPIGEDEKKKFAEDLENLDVAKMFAELESTPAPHEKGPGEREPEGEKPEGEGPEDGGRSEGA